MQSFTLEDFKKIHQEWKVSGLSIRDYCANSDIKESRFYYWKKRVEVSENLPSPTGGFIPVSLNGSWESAPFLAPNHQMSSASLSIKTE